MQTKPRIRVKPHSGYLTSLPFVSKAGHKYKALLCNDIIRKQGCIAALDEALAYYEGGPLGPNASMHLETAEHLMKIKMQLIK